MPQVDGRIVDQIRSALGCVSGVRLVLLFGSVAKGSSRSDSDIDLAIDGSPASFEEVRVLVSEATGREVDVVDVKQAGVPLLRELVQESVSVYEGTEGACGAFRSRALLELELDGPQYDRMRDVWLERVAQKGLF